MANGAYRIMVTMDRVKTILVASTHHNQTLESTNITVYFKCELFNTAIGRYDESRNWKTVQEKPIAV